MCVRWVGVKRGIVREREGGKWKVPVIKSLKECERSAHRSKQTLSPDSSLFIYAPHPSLLCPPPRLDE